MLRCKRAHAVTDLFFSRESQYRARSSGDLLDDWTILVTALLFMNRPHACRASHTQTTERSREREREREREGGGQIVDIG